MVVSPGDVVTVKFPGVKKTKRRPAVIVSSDAYHAVRPDVILGLITSRTKAATGPMDCRLADWKEAGLLHSSAFRAFLVTMPANQVTPIGQLSTKDWQAVQDRIGKAIALD